MSSGNGLTLRSLHIHMQRQVFAGGRDPAFGRVADFQVEMEPLLVEIDELQGDADLIGELEFALVEGMDLGDEERGLPLLKIVLAQADETEALLDGPIEEHMEVGHVHMAVIVDP